MERTLHLDPRTKLFMIFAVSVIVVIPAVSPLSWILRTAVTLIPLLLLILERCYKQAAVFFVVYAAAIGLMKFVLNENSTGFFKAALLGYCGIAAQFLPSLITAWYAIRTTEIDELMAALEKMRCPSGLSISLAVLLRFFPTIREEYTSINDAMRMRGIAFGGGNAVKMITYRMIPLLFSCVKIGDELSAAAITRGLGADCKRTNVCEVKIKAADILFIAVISVISTVFIITR